MERWVHPWPSANWLKCKEWMVSQRRSPWLTHNSTVVHHIDLSESLAYRSDLIPASRSIAVACLGLPIARALALTLCLLLGMYGLLAITYPLGSPLDLLHFAVGPW